MCVHATYMHTHTHVYTHTHTHVYTGICARMYIQAYVHACIYRHVCTRVRVRPYVCRRAPGLANGTMPALSSHARQLVEGGVPNQVWEKPRRQKSNLFCNFLSLKEYTSAQAGR